MKSAKNITALFFLIFFISFLRIPLYAKTANKIFSNKIYPSVDFITNRTLGDKIQTNLEYNALFINHIAIDAGFSFDTINRKFSNYYLSLGYKNIYFKGLSFNLKFLNSNYSNSLSADNSIIPYFEYKNHFIARFGLNVHFLILDTKSYNNIFCYNYAYVDPIFYYAFGYSFQITKSGYFLEIEINNHTNFKANNISYVGLEIKNKMHLDNNLNIYINFEIRTAGAIALSATAYIIRMTGGLSIEF